MAAPTDLEPEVPVVDEARIKQVHEEIQGMAEIVLDADPLSSGPKQMNNKKAAVRNHLSRCTQLELQLLEDRGWFQRELTREQAKYDITYTDLIANNPHVRAGRSTADREAAAKVILAKAVRKIKDLELSVEDLERLLTVVKAKKSDLKNLQSQLRDQLKICDHELALGNKWGHKSPSAVDGYPQTTAADLDVVDELIDSVGGSDPEPVVELVEDEDDEDEDDEVVEAVEAVEEGSVVETYESPVEDVLKIEDSEDEIEDVLAATATSTETDAALDDIETDSPEDDVDAAAPGDVDVDEILSGLEFDD